MYPLANEIQRSWKRGAESSRESQGESSHCQRKKNLTVNGLFHRPVKRTRKTIRILFLSPLSTKLLSKFKTHVEGNQFLLTLPTFISLVVPSILSLLPCTALYLWRVFLCMLNITKKNAETCANFPNGYSKHVNEMSVSAVTLIGTL